MSDQDFRQSELSLSVGGDDPTIISSMKLTDLSMHVNATDNQSECDIVGDLEDPAERRVELLGDAGRPDRARRERRRPQQRRDHEDDEGPGCVWQKGFPVGCQRCMFLSTAVLILVVAFLGFKTYDLVQKVDTLEANSRREGLVQFPEDAMAHLNTLLAKSNIPPTSPEHLTPEHIKLALERGASSAGSSPPVTGGSCPEAAVRKLAGECQRHLTRDTARMGDLRLTLEEGRLCRDGRPLDPAEIIRIRSEDDRDRLTTLRADVGRLKDYADSFDPTKDGFLWTVFKDARGCCSRTLSALYTVVTRTLWVLAAPVITFCFVKATSKTGDEDHKNVKAFQDYVYRLMPETTKLRANVTSVAGYVTEGFNEWTGPETSLGILKGNISWWSLGGLAGFLAAVYLIKRFWCDRRPTVGAHG